VESHQDSAKIHLTLFFTVRGVYSAMKAGRCRVYLSNNSNTNRNTPASQ
jgi:hypothetical protein